MKKIFIGLFALAISSAAAYAQTTDKPAKHHRGHKQEALQKINLTEAQKAQLKALREKQKQEMEALKSSKENQSVQQQRKAIQEKYKSQYQAILTPAQKEQLAQLKKEKESKGHFRKGFHGKRFEGAAMFAEKLNLTAEQQTKLQQLRTDYRSKLQAVHTNNSLTQEQKKAQIEQLSKQQQEQMKAVLTQEQLQKLEAFKKEAKGRHKARATK